MAAMSFYDAKDELARCACAARLSQDDIDITPSGGQPECRSCRGDDVLGACASCAEWVRERDDHGRDMTGAWWHGRCLPEPEEVAS